ncbi:MAG: hypothetical protein RLZZ238_1889, partial [Planctomycetota bacterium]
VGTFGWRLWVDSKEAVCAGLIAGWALLGIGDGVFGALEVYPATDAQAAEIEAKEPAGQTAALTPAELDAERALRS